tara:strand:+ start:1000 stop:2736 length:1737 start_codon:yes stop_codon:yes gene_type:complete
VSLNSAQNLQKMQHFVGVVEDRNDPLQIGRVKVRCFGIHTEDKSAIPTKQLPWAMPIMPYNSASMSGIGISGTGPVEGTVVFGLFLDGQEQQQPIVLGTMVGIPKDKIPKTVGFSDPLGVYPKEKYLKQSSTNKLARGDDAWSEESLAVKVRDRVTDVPTAVPPTAASVRDLDGPITPNTAKDNMGAPEDFYFRNKWSEPNPRSGGNAGLKDNDHCWLDEDQAQSHPWQEQKLNDGSKPSQQPSKSTYPMNHTYTTESGHVMEYDDTPDGERIHQYHKKGTFYEIQPDGSRVTKIVGDDYEIFLRGKNVVVEGNMNLTVKGDVRLLTQGNMYQEVAGDYHLRVDGDMVTKIRGNEQKVVLTNQATQINGYRKERVTGNYKKTVEGDHEVKIKGTSNTIFSSNVMIDTDGWTRQNIGGSLTISVGANTNLIIGSSKDAAKGMPGTSDSASGAGRAANTEINRYAANTGRLNIKSTSSMNFDTGSNYNIKVASAYDLSVGSTYKTSVGGAAHQTYSSTYYVKYTGENHFDHNGVWREMKGSDKYNRHKDGIDYTCPDDPTRPGEVNCDPLETPASPSHPG